MTAEHCCALEHVFDEAEVQADLRRYREHGPSPTTRWMVEAIKEARLNGVSLLDIGGGIGAVQHALLEAGAEKALGIDASTAAVRAAELEAEARGLSDRSRQIHGDFVELAPEIESADVVTLDRSICCYPDVESLVGGSAAKSRQLWAAVLPRDRWWVRLAISLLNLWMRISRSEFRSFVHPDPVIHKLLTEAGFERTFRRTNFIWQVLVYRRQSAQQAA